MPEPGRSLDEATMRSGEMPGKCPVSGAGRLRDTTVRCSCPSRKFPCKHGIGLMLLAVGSPASVPQAAPPDWVAEWLAKREEDKVKREQKAIATQTTETMDDPARAERRQAQANKMAAKRAGLVAKGLDALDRWLDDLIRSGLAGVELKPASFWESQAARMVDAQAPGIATRLRTLRRYSKPGPDWPDWLLAELGRIALLTHAFQRIDTLEPGLQDDIRSMIGWSLKEDQVVARGEAVADEWLVLGERVTTEDRLRVSRAWLLGLATRRVALVLQFAAAGAGFEENFVPGTRQQATMIYWPGAYPQRALVVSGTANRAHRWMHYPASIRSTSFSRALPMHLLASPGWTVSPVCCGR